MGKVLAAQHEDLGLGPQRPCKSQVWCHVSVTPTLRRGHRQIPGSYELGSPAESVSSRLREERSSQKTGWKQQRRTSELTSGLHMHAPPHSLVNPGRPRLLTRVSYLTLWGFFCLAESLKTSKQVRVCMCICVHEGCLLISAC